MCESDWTLGVERMVRVVCVLGYDYDYGYSGDGVWFCRKDIGNSRYIAWFFNQELDTHVIGEFV